MPGTPDLVFVGRRKVIFVNGCFWHRHNKCIRSTIPKTRVEYWEEKFGKNIARDRKNRHLLKQLGWSILAIWECELKSIQEVSKKIEEFLE